ncbi:hypothetical protein BCV70DRAFT_200008 [Testicularia cyperi]|uniref:PRELI/MSF1 domain-containing protein n=1 Tax=Testicularia cyperi TaxID=1882483 RepID=A0A317XS81_9BASI|nr:hypothetical protein BCV70DRAFT_200008 [Testicularia cyperi]
MVKDYVHQSHYDHSWSSCVRAYFLRYPNPNATHVLSVDVIDRRIEYRPVRATSSSAQGDASIASSSSTTVEDFESIEKIPVLCTTRLILKRGNLPKWAPSGLMKNAESWVIEESEVELDLFPPRASSKAEADSSSTTVAPSTPKSLMGRTKNGRAMRSWTRNLDHVTVLSVTEGLVFKERFGFMPLDTPSEEDRRRRRGKSDGKQANIAWKSYCKTLTTAQIESQVSFGILRRRIEKFGLARFVAHKDTSQQGILWTRAQLDQVTPPSASPPLSSKETELQRSSMPQKRFKLLESLRPPFLDGYPLGPLQKLKVWWYSGHYSQVKMLQDGYPIEREEDEDEEEEEMDGQNMQGPRKTGLKRRKKEQEMFRGAEQEGPWAEISGRKGKGAVYIDQDRNEEEGVINQVRKRFGLPPQFLGNTGSLDSITDGPTDHPTADQSSVDGEVKADAEEMANETPLPQGAVAKMVRTIRVKVLSLLGFDEDNLSAKSETRDRLEIIDRERTV